MKKSKLFLVITSIFCLNEFAFSQEAKIELPEITTEVTGASIEAEEDSLPDFSTIIEIPSSSEDLMPVLPEEDIPENKKKLQTVKEPSKFHGDGIIGGGYPSLLYGKFNLFQIDELSPLELNFSHDSAYGYSNKSMYSGYSDRNTQINLEKIFCVENFKIDFKGAFDTIGTGLQSKSENFSSVNQNDLFGFIKFEWKPVSVFTIGINSGVNYYTRFMDATKSFSGDGIVERWILGLNLFTANPEVFFKWADYGFSVMLAGNYGFAYDIDHSFAEGRTLHRGEFRTELCWQNDIVKILGNVGIAFGNKFNENKFIIPFTVQASLDFPTYFSTRNFKILLAGGLESKATSVSEKETEYKFAAFSNLPHEQSDWYGKLELVLPIKNTFTGKANVQYRKTAYNNGVWTPKYDGIIKDGLYDYAVVSRQLLATEFNILYNYKMFSIGGSWKANWMYVPTMEHSQMVNLEFGVNDENGIWGAEINVLLALLSSRENLPILGIDGYFSISKSVKVMLNLNDVLKLVSLKTRKYEGIYEQRGGTASLLVKYIF